MRVGVHRHDGRADEPCAALGDDIRHRMARRRCQAKRLGHRHGPIDEPIVLRNKRQVDPVAGEGLQRQQRLQAGDAAADDDDVAGRRAVGRRHGHSPGVVGTCVGSAHRGHVAGPLVRGLVGDGGHGQQAPHLVDAM